MSHHVCRVGSFKSADSGLRKELRRVMFGALTSSFSGSGSGLLNTTADEPPKKKAGRKSSSVPATSLNPLSRVAISLEYASLRYQSHCPLGMYVIPFADDPFVWDAVLFIHQGEPISASPHLCKLKSFGGKAITQTPS